MGCNDLCSALVHSASFVCCTSIHSTHVLCSSCNDLCNALVHSANFVCRTYSIHSTHVLCSSCNDLWNGLVHSASFVCCTYSIHGTDVLSDVHRPDRHRNLHEASERDYHLRKRLVFREYHLTNSIECGEGID